MMIDMDSAVVRIAIFCLHNWDFVNELALHIRLQEIQSDLIS